MKELKLLAEDFEELVIPKIGDLQVINGGMSILSTSNPKYIEGATYYRVVGSALGELKPEQRPADSIKLSECGREHIFIGEYHGDTCRVHPTSNTKGEKFFYVEVMHSGVCFPAERVKELEVAVQQIKIYDMTQ